jgi:hypothetical protein
MACGSFLAQRIAHKGEPKGVLRFSEESPGEGALLGIDGPGLSTLDTRHALGGGGVPTPGTGGPADPSEDHPSPPRRDS